MLYSSFIEKLESNRSDGRVLSLQWLLHTSTQVVIAGEDLKAWQGRWKEIWFLKRLRIQSNSGSKGQGDKGTISSFKN